MFSGEYDYPPSHPHIWLSVSRLNTLTETYLLNSGGAWVAQSVKHPTWAQVMILRLVGLSPVLGSVLTAQSLEPASVSVSPLSLPPRPPTHTLGVISINKH